jgi:ribosomal protein S18 acetylase RimI-like enzyme
MKSELRSAVPEDREFLFRLYASTRIHEIAPLGWPEAQQEAFLRMQYGAQEQWYRTAYPAADHQIIQINEQAVGRVIVLREAETWHLIDISLVSEHRGHGIGGELIALMIRDCAAAGATLKLQVLKANPALRLYHRLGFTIAGEDQIYVQMEHRRVLP